MEQSNIERSIEKKYQKPEIAFDKFSINSIRIKKRTNILIKYLELVSDENGLYDITRTQEDWHFNNSTIIDLIDKLKPFVPTTEEEFTIDEVSFQVERWLENEEDNIFSLNFNALKFNYSYIQSFEKPTKTTTPFISINELTADFEEQEAEIKYEQLCKVIDEINFNCWQFCVIGEKFPPEEIDSENLIE